MDIRSSSKTDVLVFFFFFFFFSLLTVECIVLIRCAMCFEADDYEDASYDFDLLFVRRRRSAGSWPPMAWVLPPAQVGFSACLWLRMSTTMTEGSVISLGGSQRILASHDELWPQDDRYDVNVTMDNHQVIITP